MLSGYSCGISPSIFSHASFVPSVSSCVASSCFKFLHKMSVTACDVHCCIMPVATSDECCYDVSCYMWFMLSIITSVIYVQLLHMMWFMCNNKLICMTTVPLLYMMWCMCDNKLISVTTSTVAGRTIVFNEWQKPRFCFYEWDDIRLWY